MSRSADVESWDLGQKADTLQRACSDLGSITHHWISLGSGVDSGYSPCRKDKIDIKSPGE